MATTNKTEKIKNSKQETCFKKDYCKKASCGFTINQVPTNSADQGEVC